MDIENILDNEIIIDDEINDSCRRFIETCEEYIVGYIDFYTFFNLIEPHKFITCLDDLLFIKLIKKFAEEEELVFDVYYSLENQYSFFYEKLKLAKFFTILKKEIYSETFSLTLLEELIKDYCSIYYFSKSSLEERRKFMKSIIILLNIYEHNNKEKNYGY